MQTVETVNGSTYAQRPEVVPLDSGVQTKRSELYSLSRRSNISCEYPGQSTGDGRISVAPARKGRRSDLDDPGLGDVY